MLERRNKSTRVDSHELVWLFVWIDFEVLIAETFDL
jgi:hypothetical protein